VISLTGVWGFKGKNEFGAITVLSDWDRIAIKDRLVYLAFDSDIVSKEMVRKALEHLGEHLSHKGAGILVVYLPQEGNQKSASMTICLVTRWKKPRNWPLTSGLKTLKAESGSYRALFWHDGTIGELVVSKEDERAFIIVVNGSVRKVFRYERRRSSTCPW